MMQHNVERGVSPRTVELLIAKGFVRIERRNGQRRYLITERGKIWMGI